MEKRVNIELLILGGGVSGSACAWQAAKMGRKVLLVEETPWLGGMITSAGVSAFDGNKKAVASGFFLMIRKEIEAYYGGPEKTFTGWISHHCFEPKVAEKMIRKHVLEAGVEVLFNTRLVEVLRKGNRILGAIVENAEGRIRIEAKLTVEATEYGDVLHLGNVPYRLGRESKEQTGEDHAPAKPDMKVQDMTLCAIMKKAPSGKATPLPLPADYNPDEFDCAVTDRCSTPDAKFLNHALHDWNSFITYAALPNDKYLLNWPFHSNDSPDSVGIFGTPSERAEAIEKARARTLAFCYYMQNELNHPEWGLATDEFGTPDHLAFIPYVRESRRVIGKTILKENDVLPPTEGGPRAKFQADSIAIGDYFLDHHHSEEHLPPDQRLNENYPDNAPFQIPFGSLVPKDVDGLLVAEKSISVTHIVNGCSRLQPVVMLIGQAAGMAAALCLDRNLDPRELDAAELQDELIEAGVAVYPFSDLYNAHPAFGAVQRLAMTGLFPADQPMEFKPDEPISKEDAAFYEEEFDLGGLWKPGMRRGDFFIRLYESLESELEEE
jgi:hypothetical protein